jgi:hypothetical protein
MSKVRLAFLVLIVATVVYVAAFAGAWYRVYVAGITWRNIYAVGTVLFFMWYAVVLYSAVKKNQSEGMKLEPKLTRLRTVATILAIIGGVTSAVCGGVMWVPYLLTGVDWGWFFPWFGFVGFVLGMLIILGGIFIIRGRSFLGGNLAIWCGIASIYGGGVIATMQTLSFLHFHWIAVAVLSITLTILCPVLGGVLGLMSRR